MLLTAVERQDDRPFLLIYSASSKHVADRC
ncbi:hypothetical protein [Sodalinema gerasimenkoae]|nr:hypothetical protein [Sodalinema gerasimenkoae]